MLYYKVLQEGEKCLTTSDHIKSLEVATIRVAQSLYCSGLDLERPLMLSLSPCSNKHKQEVNGCINDFAKAFSSNFSQPSLCRYSIRYYFFLSNESSNLMGSSRDPEVKISRNLHGKGQHYKKGFEKERGGKHYLPTSPAMISPFSEKLWHQACKCCLRYTDLPTVNNISISF